MEESRELYQAIFRAAPDGILLVDRGGVIREVNEQALGIFGYSREELEGANVDLLVPDAVRAMHRGHREGYAHHPRTRPMGVGLELAGRRKDGTEVPVEISLSPLGEGEEFRVVAIVRDLTERRRLRGFGAGALRAMEEERRRIARELHDDTAQELATLLLRLTLLERKVILKEAAEEIAELKGALHAVAEGVRRIARGLRPPELGDAGLEAALRSHARERYPEGEVEIAFDGSEQALGEDEVLALYRIVQEALFNAVRHGGATRVRIEGRREPDRPIFFLTIADNGRGFDPRAVRRGGAGLGLMGMEERAQIVGGEFTIESEIGGGTRVRVRLPLEEEER